MSEDLRIHVAVDGAEDAARKLEQVKRAEDAAAHPTPIIRDTASGKTWVNKEGTPEVSELRQQTTAQARPRVVPGGLGGGDEAAASFQESMRRYEAQEAGINKVAAAEAARFSKEEIATERQFRLENQLEAMRLRAAGDVTGAEKLERENAVRLRALDIEQTLNIEKAKAVQLAEADIAAQEQIAAAKAAQLAEEEASGGSSHLQGMRGGRLGSLLRVAGLGEVGTAIGFGALLGTAINSFLDRNQEKQDKEDEIAQRAGFQSHAMKERNTADIVAAETPVDKQKTENSIRDQIRQREQDLALIKDKPATFMENLASFDFTTFKFHRKTPDNPERDAALRDIEELHGELAAIKNKQVAAASAKDDAWLKGYNALVAQGVAPQEAQRIEDSRSKSGREWDASRLINTSSGAGDVARAVSLAMAQSTSGTQHSALIVAEIRNLRHEVRGHAQRMEGPRHHEFRSRRGSR